MTRIYSLAGVSEELGDDIAYAVQAFADQKGLQCDLWHQDAPVWIVTDLPVWKTNIGRLVRKLEVGVFRVGSSLEIQVIPDVYRIAQGKRKAIRPGRRRELTESLPMHEFRASIVQHGREGATQALGRLLQQAWKSIEQYTEADLT